MRLVLFASMMIALILVLGLVSWHLEMREREERLTEEALETAQLLDAALEERMNELNAYRHDLAALLQELDLEQVRAAERQASE